MPLSPAAQAALNAARAARTNPTTGRLSPAQLAQALKPPPAPPNPLDAIEQTDDLQADSLAELDAIDAATDPEGADPTGFAARARAEENRYADATESAFYVTVGFLSAEDKETFLARTGMTPADVYGDLFLDGYQLAAKIGIDLTRKE